MPGIKENIESRYQRRALSSSPHPNFKLTGNDQSHDDSPGDETVPMNSKENIPSNIPTTPKIKLSRMDLSEASSKMSKMVKFILLRRTRVCCYVKE